MACSHLKRRGHEHFRQGRAALDDRASDPVHTLIAGTYIELSSTDSRRRLSPIEPSRVQLSPHRVLFRELYLAACSVGVVGACGLT